MCVCTRSERARGHAFPTPTCHYLALQFAPLILCHFLVGCGVKTNSLHSVLKLKSIHLSKQGSLSRFGARLIPEWDSVHLSMAKKSFLRDKSQPRQSFCHMFVCCSKRIPLAGLESRDEALLVLHQLRFYPVFIIFESLERLWFSQTNLRAHASCLRHLCFPTWPPAIILLPPICIVQTSALENTMHTWYTTNELFLKQTPHYWQHLDKYPEFIIS